MNFSGGSPVLGSSSAMPYEWRSDVLVARPHISRPRIRSRLAVTCLLTALAGCATHRGDPPRCTGAYTPINPSSVASHDAQR